MDSHIQPRVFDEIETRNFRAQHGVDRYPESRENGPGTPFGPPMESWRINLVALSAKYNLYFLASQGKIHMYVPKDLRNTISGTAELVLDIPVSEAALKVTESIDLSDPHCVNNMKIGDFGNLEILMTVLDDGDVVGYYTHTIDHEVQIAMKEGHKKPPIKSLRPFFHENVGSTAWGLAIHKDSRLIAVGSNRKVVTVFALSYCATPVKRESDHEESEQEKCEHKGSEQGGRDEKLIPSDNEYVENKYNLLLEDALTSTEEWVVCKVLHKGRSWANLRLEMTLPPGGHNIPSLDFTEDEYGHANTVLAADIFGNLWQFDIHKGTVRNLPPMKKEIGNQIDMMGWGVVVIPRTMFRDTKSPYEALGVSRVRDAWKFKSKLEIFPGCFDITASIQEVRHASQNHPTSVRDDFYYRELESVTPSLELDEDDDELPFNYAKSLESLRKKLYTLLIPPFLPQEPSTEWDFRKIIRSDLNLYDERLFDKVRAVIKDNYPTYLEAERSVRFLKFYLNLNPALRSQNVLLKLGYDAKTLYSAKKDYEKSERDAEELGVPYFPEQQEPISAGHCAVLVCHRIDIHLIPPLPYSAPQTICKGVLKLSMPPNVEPLLEHFERICLQAIIPPLGLVVVATQAGRAALVTVTRMPPSMSSLTEVITMRLELFLPLKKDEDAHRPHEAPLLGLAVAPVMSSGRGKQGGLRASAWRLFLHYRDHTILSYELFRGEGEELVVS